MIYQSLCYSLMVPVIWKLVLIMEKFLFLDRLKLASFRGMKNYIIPGTEWSNSLAPLRHWLPPFITLSLLHTKLLSTSAFPHLLFHVDLYHS